MSLETITSVELADMVIPAPRQIIPGVVTEGLNILAGSPKTGKSFLSLGMALAVSNGKPAFDNDHYDIKAPQGVLYLALEDTLFRLKGRLATLRQPANDLLRFSTALPRLGEGGLNLIDEHLHDHPETVMVVIDTLAKVADPKTGGNVYEEDAALGGALHSLAHSHGIAIVVVHHTRKAAHGDFLHMVSGSAGFTGTADTVAVMTRDRNKADAVLEVTGRDIREKKLNLIWYAGRGGWIVHGSPTSNLMSR